MTSRGTQYHATDNLDFLGRSLRAHCLGKPNTVAKAQAAVDSPPGPHGIGAVDVDTFCVNATISDAGESVTGPTHSLQPRPSPALELHSRPTGCRHNDMGPGEFCTSSGSRPSIRVHEGVQSLPTIAIPVHDRNSQFKSSFIYHTIYNPNALVTIPNIRDGVFGLASKHILSASDLQPSAYAVPPRLPRLMRTVAGHCAYFHSDSEAICRTLVGLVFMESLFILNLSCSGGGDWLEDPAVLATELLEMEGMIDDAPVVDTQASLQLSDDEEAVE
ncbi:hypothetical protein DFH27DRAFT_630496 [Peziza echinospora]|nr:hypothetical protein DFH27DRAFT_630496 [Peziza echinospora]